LPEDSSSQPLKDIDTFEDCFSYCISLLTVPYGLFSLKGQETPFLQGGDELPHLFKIKY
jgi:hypothetical protein